MFRLDVNKCKVARIHLQVWRSFAHSLSPEVGCDILLHNKNSKGIQQCKQWIM